MELEANPERVRCLAEEREDENWDFRTFLKNVHLDPEEVDAIVHRHHAAVSEQIDCLECGNCCREILPKLSEADIQRLASALEVLPAEIIRRHLLPHEDKEQGSFTMNAKPCPFLAGNTCTVYNARPDDCRSYPHLHKEDFVFRLMGVVGNCSICPIVFNVYERLKDELWDGSDEPYPDSDW